MKPVITFLLTLLLNISLIRGSEREKCCKPDYRFVERDSTFKCEYNPNKRYQSNFRNNDLLNTNSSGNCIEIYNENATALFSFNNSTRKISRSENVQVKYFPKCCPVGLEYNDIIHSCAVKRNNDNLKGFFSDNRFIKIGLPYCDIISDHILNSSGDVKIDDEGLVFVKTSKRIPVEKYCIDSTLEGKFVTRVCEENLQICERIRCIRKCCPDGKSFINGSNCFDTFKYGLDLKSSSKIQDPDVPFAIIHGIPGKIYRLVETKYDFFLDKTGTFGSYMNKTDSFTNSTISDESYCMEYTYKNGIFDNYFLFAKSVIPPLETKFAVTRWPKIVSCIFLLLTISVYLILPKMRNLFGKILLSYSIATFLFFFSLCISQFYYNVLNDATCQSIGFISLLTSIWSFTWLHIMCIDIWCSFGKKSGFWKKIVPESPCDLFAVGPEWDIPDAELLIDATPRTLTGPLQKNEFKRLLQYSLYGWGFPIMWVLLILLFKTTTIVPEQIRPYVGVNKCYMENYDSKPGNYAYFLYVILPLFIQQIINTVLFVKTVMYCLKIKAEVERMNDAKRKSDLNAGRERLGLIMKLAVIMGVSYIFETVSSIYNFRNTTITTYIEVVWDTVNCLQGVFVFIVFICKKKIFDKLREKIPILKPRKCSVSSSATTQVSMHQISGNKREKTP